MPQTICNTCGNPFHCKVYRVKASGNYCSRACFWESERPKRNAQRVPRPMKPPKTRHTVPCTQCGKILYREPRLIRQNAHHFCNRACRGAWNSTRIGPSNPTWTSQQVACTHCGKMLFRKPCHIRSQTRFFCDRTCHAQWMAQHQVGENSPTWKGGYHSYYGLNWGQQSHAARKRDNYRCQGCGKRQKKRAFDVHHIKPFRLFGYIPGENDRYLEANQLENLITLCKSCHKLVEAGKLSVQIRLF